MPPRQRWIIPTRLSRLGWPKPRRLSRRIFALMAWGCCSYAGRCHEAHPKCEQPHWLVCLDCAQRKAARCGRSSRTVCNPCGETYRRRVKRVFASGWSDNPLKAMIMLTVTAPGDQAHTLPNGQRCPCTPEGGVVVGEFNSVAGQAFNRLVQDLRRRYGDVQYARAAEVQKRGALHFHIVMRVPRLGTLLGDLDKRNPFCVLRQLVERHGFGHEIELEPATESAAWYCAKYVSKSCDDRQTLPWLDRHTGELSEGHSGAVARSLQSEPCLCQGACSWRCLRAERRPVARGDRGS